LTNELVEKKEFFKPITIKEIVFFMINNSIKFKTNMDKSIIPPPSGEWTADSSFQALIKVTPETILIMYPLNDRDAKVSTEKPRKFFFFQENKNGSSHQSRGQQHVSFCQGVGCETSWTGGHPSSYHFI